MHDFFCFLCFVIAMWLIALWQIWRAMKSGK